MSQRSNFLLSEIRELELLLEGTPESAVIQRISLESRLKLAQTALARNDVPCTPPLLARLTFRGRPVVGSRGMAADFGGKAANAFSDAFAAVIAGLNEGLQFMGPIPDREKNQLLITGTAVGSFGFEFELPPPGLFSEENKAAEALQKIQSLLEASALGSDDDVAEFVDAIHPRAVKKISEFLGLLSNHHAWCGVEFEQKMFRFEGLDQLERSVGRLGEANIKEEPSTQQGKFVGVLPNSRTFEFHTAEGLIKGKIGARIDDPDSILRDWLKREVEITFDMVQVGKGRPRFTLNALPSLSEPSSRNT